MKRIAAVALAVLCAAAGSAAADSRSSVSVQGVLRDHSGGLQSLPVDLTIKLYSAADAAMPFFTRALSMVAVDNGFFSVELSGMGLSFGSDDVWIGVQVAGDAVEMPRQHVTAVPMSLSAASLACPGCLQEKTAVILAGILPYPGDLPAVAAPFAAVTIEAKSAGTVIAFASGDVSVFNHVHGTVDSIACNLRSPQLAGQGVQNGFAVPQDLPSFTVNSTPMSWPMALSNIFRVPAAGSYTFTVSCDYRVGCGTPNGPGNGGASCYVNSPRVQALFIPMQ